MLLSDGKAAWSIDKDGFNSVPFEELEKKDVSVPQPKGFGMLTWEGRNAVIVRAPEGKDLTDPAKDPTGLESADPVLNTFALATHEQFHTYAQQGKTPWKSLEELSGGGREELYPLNAEPRLQRAMVYNSLLAAYEEPDERREHLSAATYWHQQWAKKYPDEDKTQAGIELLEGTAKYFELAAVAMAAADDPENAGQRRDHLTGALKPMKLAFKNVEPYAIGALALLVAQDEQEVKKSLAETPATPLSKVIGGVAPAGQTAPEDVKAGIEESVAKSNEELGNEIEPFMRNFKDPEKWLLMAPVGDLVNQNLSGMGFYTTEELPVSIVPKARGAFKFTTGKLTLDGTTTAQIELNGEGYFAIPLDPEDESVSLDGNKLALKGPHAEGSFTVRSETDEDGQRTFYAR